MNNKRCVFCASDKVVKNGYQNSVRIWKCKSCSKRFQANKKVLPSKEELFCLFAFNKQSFAELTQFYHMRRKTLQDLIYSVEFKKKVHKPRGIHLSVDTTFFDNFAVVVFRDFYEKENLWFKFIDTERLIYYQEGKEYLEKIGYEILSVTADGLIGLPFVFKDIPFQFCHFHAKKAVTKYTTLKPKNIAGQELLNIMIHLRDYTEISFIKEIDMWFSKYHFFLKEKTIHPTGNWSYTHKKLRSALRSIQRMSNYLFAYQVDKNIPSTTNTLEGHFSHLKVRLSVHRGLSKAHKQKVIAGILINSTTSFKLGMEQYLFPK
jgi:hypothetical protein